MIFQLNGDDETLEKLLLRSSEMWRHVVSYQDTNISEEFSFCILKPHPIISNTDAAV
jgi:hypothetical protein